MPNIIQSQLRVIKNLEMYPSFKNKKVTAVPGIWDHYFFAGHNEELVLHFLLFFRCFFFPNV